MGQSEHHLEMEWVCPIFYVDKQISIKYLQVFLLKTDFGNSRKLRLNKENVRLFACLFVYRLCVPIVPLTSYDVCVLFVDSLIVCVCGQDCSRAVSIRDDRLY